MRDDEVRAAAERLIEEAAAHIEAVVSGGHDPLTDDILTVARAALKAEQEATRMREVLESAGIDLIGFEGFFERAGSMGTVASIRRTLAKIDAVLSTPGGPESSGRG